MPRKKIEIDKLELNKGELRKLNALKKSVGQEFGEEVFLKWYAHKQAGSADDNDPNIALLQDALTPLFGKIRFPRGVVYQIQRGRSSIVVVRNSK